MKTMIAALVSMTAAAGAGAETWNFTLSSMGEDVMWVSPTGVDPAAFSYDSSYVITSAVATVSVFGAPVQVEVIDEIPEELRSGMLTVAGPAPVLLFDEFIASPPPPEAPALAADVRIELDSMGFARASATNVVFGTVTQNVPPFGNLTVPLIGVAFTGTITFDEVLTRPEDLDVDGSVGASDLAILLAAWGACPAGPPCPADVDGNGSVGASDLAMLLAAWGA